MGLTTSSLRRGGQSRATTTPMWQVSVNGMDDLHSIGTGQADFAPGREGEVGLSEHLSIMGYRLLHSRAYNLLYATLILLSGVALAVALWTPSKELSSVVVVLDVAITLSLLVEVVIRMIVLGRQRFWSDRSNRYDCFVCALCVVTCLLYLFEGPSESEKVEQVFAILVVGGRYTIQLARLSVFVRSYKRTASGSTADIDLSDDPEQGEPLIDAGQPAADMVNGLRLPF
ncbi:hypothetical protein T492DRAFT_930493 [Pavlovales sp. CCMP2436]|nr:hypothetical protein T492DRAFT_930493 [Pavlovales sp. CCMP2436]